jgi:Tol biopolymer transport system component
MTHRDDLDRLLSAWLDDPYTPPAPHYLGRVLERTRQTRQRPAWASLERWIPMADSVLHPPTAPPLRMAWLLILALLVVALAAGVVVVGSRLLAPTPVIPQGGAAVAAFGSFVGNVTGQTGGDIFTVRADGTDLRQLTNGRGIRSGPVFSPDGTRIAYRESLAGSTSVVVMDTGGGNRMTLATTPDSGAFCSKGGLAWSPDGTSLVFPTSPVCDLRYELFIVATDGSSPATRLLAPGIDSAFPDWSPDGRQIAFLGSEAGGASAVYVADLGSADTFSGGLRARRIGPGPGVPLTDSASGPQWSPDGKELVASTGSLATISEPSSIVIMTPDGSEQRVIAEDMGNPMWSPIWAPSGRQLAYVRAVDPSEYFSERPCTVRAWVIDTDGSNQRQLDPLADGCDMVPAWSPDGTRLAVLLIGVDDPNPSFHISMITLDGSEPIVTLGDGAVGSWQPVVAPIPPAPSFEAAAPSP